MHTLKITFSDLPLAIVDDRDCGLSEGEAEIEFNGSGEWGVTAIWLDGHGRGGWKPARLDMGTHAQLYAHMIEMIEDRCARHIESEIDEYWIAAREAAAEARYEARRDDRMMGL